VGVEPEQVGLPAGRHRGAAPRLRILARDRGDVDEALRRLFRRGQAEGTLRADLPAAWLVHAYRGLLYGVAVAAQRGDIAPREAPRLVLSALLGGAARPPTGGATKEGAP
jgi:hypothetical protein